MLLSGVAIGHVRSLSDFIQQEWNLLRGVLQIVVQRDNLVKSGGADSTEQRIVLAIISHKVDAPNPIVGSRKPADYIPTAVPAAVVHEYSFELLPGLAQDGVKPCHQVRQAQLTVKDGNQNRDSCRDRADILYHVSSRNLKFKAEEAQRGPLVQVRNFQVQSEFMAPVLSPGPADYAAGRLKIVLNVPSAGGSAHLLRPSRYV